LIDRLTDGQPHLNQEDVELGVKTIVDQMSDVLAQGERIEIRGFGAFSLRRRESRVGRNPRTGELVVLPEHHAGRVRLLPQAKKSRHKAGRKEVDRQN